MKKSEKMHFSANADIYDCLKKFFFSGFRTQFVFKFKFQKSRKIILVDDDSTVSFILSGLETRSLGLNTLCTM